MEKYVHSESVDLVFSGNDYFERLSEIISSAQEVVHLQTYIIESDNTGNLIKEKLIQASKRGVKIYFLADAFGSKNLSKGFIEEMESANIQLRFFSPLLSSEGIFFGRRLHHKIVVADKRTALIGGINIADKYCGTEDEPAWLDYAVLVKGRCCGYLHHICERIYDRKKIIEPKKLPALTENGPLVSFTRNDWVRGKNEIHKNYRKAIAKAEKQIVIVASYFLPGFLFQRRLKQALKRGVRVIIIVAGKTDVPFIHLAEKFLQKSLLKMGAEIYEWKNSVLHGKGMLSDNDWATIGSYNVNHLSHYRSIEMNVNIMNTDFSKTFSDHLETIIEKHCSLITLESLERQGIFHRLKIKTAYYLVKISLNLLMPRRKVNL